MDSLYKLNQPQVACEELSGDLMLLHFGLGLYYNLQGIGADVCVYLLDGGSPAAAKAALAGHFGIQEHQIDQDISTFVSQLLHEGLLAESEGPPNPKPMRITAQVYEPPRFQKYDDMADQLLLDKIEDQSPNALGSASPRL